MSIPARPPFEAQGPVGTCVISGKDLSWLNCTAVAVATMVNQVHDADMTGWSPNGCQMRRATGDTSGGTTLQQYVPNLKAHNIATERHVGSDVASPFYLAAQVQKGRPAVVQGNTNPLVRTTYRSTAGGVNHAVLISRVRGGKYGEPSEALVFDPAADNRKSYWGQADKGPTWWPWWVVLAFCADLRPWNDSRKLGPGKVYCLIGPDLEPHVHKHYSGLRTSPFPDRTRVDQKTLWAHTSPQYGKGNRADLLREGDLFTAYQRTVRSGREWLGDHNGKVWVPAAKMRHVGGTQ